MKKQLAIISTILATAGMSAFGQGFITFSTSTHELFDEFTTAGGGGTPLYPANGALDVTFLWAATGTQDTLPTVGTLLSGKGGGSTAGEVATNGVTSIAPTAIGAISNLLSSGWSLASVAGGSAEVSTVANSTGSISAGQFQLAGSTAGSTYEIIVIAWNASSASGYASAADIGWSNPFNYLTGAAATDPNGQVAFSSSGMNQFGVAAVQSVPEPASLALAGLGGLSTLFLRRV